MDTLGARLKHDRKSKGFTQDALADKIGVSRVVIFNLEKNKTEPQVIVVNAICQTLNIDREWLIDGIGEMEDSSNTQKSAKILAELYEVSKDLSEEEQLYLLDIIKAFNVRLGKKDNE